MALFTWVLAVTAGATSDALDQPGNSWKYRYIPYDCIVEVMHGTSAVGVTATITAGSDEIVQESPVSIGLAAGTLPARLNTEPVTFKAKAGDLVIVRYRNTTGGTLTINGVIELTPSK